MSEECVGVRVVRGRDWKWGDQDGGEGCLGTVVEMRDNNMVAVRWDGGASGVYSAGDQGTCDLRVYDNAPAGEWEQNEPMQTNDVYYMYCTLPFKYVSLMFGA